MREYVPFFEMCYKQVYHCTRQLCGQQWDDLAGESRQWGGGASSLLPTLRCLAPWDRTEAPNWSAKSRLATFWWQQDGAVLVWGVRVRLKHQAQLFSQATRCHFCNAWGTQCAKQWNRKRKIISLNHIYLSTSELDQVHLACRTE